jgi:hypothetical protein
MMIIFFIVNPLTLPIIFLSRGFCPIIYFYNYRITGESLTVGINSIKFYEKYCDAAILNKNNDLNEGV